MLAFRSSDVAGSYLDDDGFYKVSRQPSRWSSGPCRWLAWYLVVLVSARFIEEGSTRFVNGVSDFNHARHMWDDGLRQKAKLFARPASGTAFDMRAVGTTSTDEPLLFELFTTCPPAPVDQLVTVRNVNPRARHKLVACICDKTHPSNLNRIVANELG